jgi:hypothetical protein
MARAWLVAGLVLVLLGPEVAFAELVYAFEWKSYSRISRQVDDETVGDEGELGDVSQLTLRRTARGDWQFSFSGPQGRGTGLVTARGPERLTFPTAMRVGQPPAPQHLRGGWFTFTGRAECPATFRLEYAEGFLCRTMPVGCEHVLRWERRLAGSATLTHGDKRCR